MHANLRPGEDDRWLHSVVEKSSEIVTVVDPDGTLRYANPAWERALGYDPDGAIGKMNVLDHVHPEDLGHVLEETEKALAEGGVTTNEAQYRFRHKDGSWRWMESVGTYLLDDPAVGGVVVVSRDVTERKEAEEALRESERRLRRAEQRYRMLVERVPAVVYVQQIGSPESAMYMSPQIEALTGYTPEECQNTDLRWRMVHPEDRERMQAEDERTGEPDEVFASEYRVVHRDGQTVWVRNESVLVEDEEGGSRYWQGFMIDITERRRVEASLKESEQRFRRSFDDAAIGMALVGTDGRFLRTNRSLREILGYSGKALLGKTFQDITHPDELEADLDHLGRMLAGEIRTHQIEKRYIHKEGHVVWALLSVSVVHDEEGEPLYFVSHIQDISERKRAEEALKESEERFRGTFEDAPIGVALVSLPSPSPDSATRYLRVNRALCEMLGYSEEELLSMTSSDVTHPEDLEESRARLERLLEEGGSKYTIEKRYVRSDGRVVWAMLNVSLVRNSEGNPSHFVSQYQDVTQRKETEEALRHSEERYRNVVEKQTELVCRFLPDLTLTFVNDAYCRYFEKGSEELVGSRLLDHVVEEDRAYYEEQLVRLNPHRPTATLEERVFTPGGMRWLQWTDTAIFDVDGHIVEYQSVGRDVTERREAEERLEHLAFHDPLTDLPNRHLFLDRLGRALERTRRRRGRKAAVLFMDLDGFKVVNDSLGHEVGDLLLTVVAQRLGRCLRPEDTLARFGGDEFVVLIEDIDDSVEAVQVAERITQELRRPFIMEGRELYVTASIGVSLGDTRTHDPDDLLREADTAMYRVKGEDEGFRVFDLTMYERAFRRLELENDFRRAIEQEEFVVHYQPIVRLDDDGRIWRIEALVRWDHPERGLLNPDEFVPIAEESGLVVPMGEQVLEQACRRAVEWQRQFPHSRPLVMCVNLSARQLSRPDLAESVERVLGETGMEGGCLSLDVTETVYVSTLERNTVVLDRLRGLGVGFSIDDFGTGYSSLSYLKRLPADVIKIDKSFVESLGREVEDTAIVRMIIGLAHTLRMEVIAEGVESEEQARLLKELGCDFAQGFHFSKPLPPEEIPALLSTDTPT